MNWRSLTARAATAAAVMLVVTAAAAAPAKSADVQAQTHNVTVSFYIQHLNQLDALVTACAKGRDAASCDPSKVGKDDAVSMQGQNRVVRYGWLRALLAEAGKPREKADAKDKKAGDKKTGKEKKEKSAAPERASWLPPPLTNKELLQMAHERITADLAQATALLEGVPPSPPEHAQVRKTMKKVFAEKEFRYLGKRSLSARWMEKLAEWLNHIFSGMPSLRLHSPWVGLAVKVGFYLGICVALVWGLIQLERRWRLRLVPLTSAMPAAGAASARDWQLWLEDARRAAAEGHWREAIHFVYWAAISRLESRRLWPADRARTPREYLALVAADDPRKAGLKQLTVSFERTWYGGRKAGEEEFRNAAQIAQELIASTAATGWPKGGGR